MKATSRYSKTTPLPNNTYSVVIPPTIPRSDKDIYVLWDERATLQKISIEYYGSPKYWWVILAANNVAIEGDIKFGHTIRIPPLDKALGNL